VIFEREVEVIVHEQVAGREDVLCEDPAYRNGWQDGRFGQPQPFGVNNNLALWPEYPDRLSYYRGHRDGRRVRELLGGNGKPA
jgi:hypothetical protein